MQQTTPARWLACLLPSLCCFAAPQQSEPKVNLLYTFRASGVPTFFTQVTPSLFWGIDATAGQIFSVTTTGTYTTIYTFPTSPSGVTALGVTPALNGDIYGGLSGGGTSIADLYVGTPKGDVTLYAYNGATQGAPFGVVQHPDNYLYAFFEVTGGSSSVFTRLDYQGKTKPLYTLASSQGTPYGAPFLGMDSSLYGLSVLDNFAQVGIYRLATSGSFSWIIPSIPAGKSGVAGRLLALIQATNGKFYGTLPYGGSANGGAIYEASL
jgi:hypothetical protein